MTTIPGCYRNIWKRTPPQNSWVRYRKEDLVKRTMRISDRPADAIGLDKTYPKCKQLQEKQKEVLALTMTRNERK